MQKPPSTGTDDPVRPTTPTLPPKITRLEGDAELTVPHGYRASVLLALVDHADGDRYYARSAVVEQHGNEGRAMSYKHSGAQMLRFDVPEGMPISAESLEPHLATFLASNAMFSPGPPIIKESVQAA